MAIWDKSELDDFVEPKDAIWGMVRSRKALGAFRRPMLQMMCRILILEDFRSAKGLCQACKAVGFYLVTQAESVSLGAHHPSS